MRSQRPNAAGDAIPESQDGDHRNSADGREAG